MAITNLTRRGGLALFALTWLVFAANGCAQGPSVAAVAIPPIPPGEARVWFYRQFIPSESLNMTEVRMNGAYVGYSQLGGAFYRDVPPGQYHVTVATWGVDVNQSAIVALVSGQEAFIRIESLSSWSDGGQRHAFQRDTFYARLIPPQMARTEITQSTYNGGG